MKWFETLILRSAAIYITIFGYTLFSYGLTFSYISFHSFFWRNWKQREIEGNLKVIWGEFATDIWVLQYLIMQPFLPIIIFYFFFLQRIKSFWPKSSINSFLPTLNLRQLKFTIIWQYKFLNYSSYTLTIKIVQSTKSKLPFSWITFCSIRSC